MIRYQFPLFSLSSERSPLETALGAKVTGPVVSRHDAVDAVIAFANGDISPLPSFVESTRAAMAEHCKNEMDVNRERLEKTFSEMLEPAARTEIIEEIKSKEANEEHLQTLDKLTRLSKPEI